MKQKISNITATLAYLAFCATIILIPFHLRLVLMERLVPSIYVDYTDFFLFASDVTLIATLVCWGASLLLSPRRIEWGPTFITVPLVGVTVIGAISTISSVDAALSFYHAIRLLLLGGLYLFIINGIRSLGQVLLSVTLQVLLQSFVGIGQFLQHHSIGLGTFGELALDPTGKGISVIWSGQSILLRAYGLTDHPNILGGCLAFALIILVFASLQSSPRWRSIIALTVALGGLALFLTFSRAAWFAFAGASVFILGLFFRTKQSSTVKDSVILLAVALLVVLPFGWQYSGYLGTRLNVTEPSMFTGENRSIVERDLLSDAAIKTFSDHTVLGIGLGTFPIALSIAQPNFQFDYQPPHLVLLDVAAEIGILGACFYIALMFSPWVALWMKRNRLNADAQSFALVVASGLVLATTLVGLFDYYTWLLAPGRLWQWITWGLWAMTYQTWITRTGV